MRILVSTLLWCSLGAALHAQITLRASTMLDGRGAVRHNVRLTIEGSKIARVDADTGGAVSYDLTGLTLMPGWIDTHVHINSHLNKDGRANTRGEPPAESALRTQGILWDTLQGGFTTVRSVGADSDKEFRDLIAGGVIPGPRVLTSLATFNEHSGTPEEIREKVRQRVAQGADVIKLFATASSRDGGAQTMTDAQIEAACSEAKALGRPAAVHAHASGGARPAILSGCTSIEHGTFLTDEVLDLMAQRGVYLDPNLSNVTSYIEHKQAFLGLGNYTEQGFAEMAKDLPIRYQLIQRAMARHVKIVFGTDAVAGQHGHNSEEFIMRVHNAGQPPMEAIISATSRAAESIGLGSQIGTIGPGMEADLVATAGNPLEDITNVRRVTFVMKSGKVFRNSAH
jgi:imidazolonepropionase-like amidohydrolase